jgi:hypothetical protein
MTSRDFVLERFLQSPEYAIYKLLFLSNNAAFFCIFLTVHLRMGAPGGAVGCGTALQAGRSPVRFQIMSL